MVTVLPFILFAAYGMFRIQDVISRYEDAVHYNYEIKAQAVGKSIRRIVSQMETAATVLSTSEEISKALQKSDNNVLFDISNRFNDPISIFLLILILNRQLKPYSMIVGVILNYANKEIDGDTLKKRLTSISRSSGYGGAKIANALIQMLDVMEANFRKIREYNDELYLTNRKLEKSLNEVKKIK